LASSAPDTKVAEAALVDLVTFIAKKLVDLPEEVHVHPVEEDGALVLELEVAIKDLGKVIGKQGRTARALRQLISTAAMKHRTRAVLEILE
jgi:predicted RNA-binding protein YlqC (UPF0109 family)